MAVVQRLDINRSVARRPRVIKARIARTLLALVATAVVLLVVAALAYTGRLALTHFLRHPSFVIRHVLIVCRGVRTVPDNEIVARARIVSNMNIYATSLAPMEQRLRQHPDIATVEITKRPPDALVITFSEREPVALLKLPDGPHDIPIDRDGVMLSARKLPYASHVPALEGLPAALYKPGAALDDARVPPALQFVDALRRMQQQLFLDISTIQFGNPKHVSLTSASIDEIRLGATYSLNDVTRLLKTVEALHRQRRNARCIDLRFADVVVIPYSL
jgi:cell division septal protein FtsQ